MGARVSIIIYDDSGTLIPCYVPGQMDISAMQLRAFTHREVDRSKLSAAQADDIESTGILHLSSLEHKKAS